jgi:polysaccharide pyruvyl transferase WcaK-like protein
MAFRLDVLFRKQPMRDKPVTIGLLNHIGGGNCGDDATLDAVMQNIRARWANAEIHAFTMNPKDTELRHSVPSYQLRRQTWTIDCTPTRSVRSYKKIFGSLLSRPAALSWLLTKVYWLTWRLPVTVIRELRFLIASSRRVKRLDLLVMSGGGQLTERDGPWAFPYTLFKWALLAKMYRVKCIFLNLGAGPLSHPLSKMFARRALTAAEYASFRDSESEALARSIGFRGTSWVFPDCVYGLECPAPLIKRRMASDRLLVGFAPVPYGDPRLHPAEKTRCVYSDYLAKCATITSSLAAQQCSVSLFGTDIGVDPLAIADLLTAIGERGIDDLPKCIATKGVQETLEAMSEMDYVITCRFHGVVFAHILNKPVLAIAHHPKVETLMKALGLEKYCVDIRKFTPNQVMDAFASLVNDRDVVRSKMAISLASYRTQLAMQLDGLFPRDRRPIKA